MQRLEKLKMKPTDTPQCYLSHSPHGWSLIFRESPLCDYKKTPAEVLQVAAHFKLTPHNYYWNGISGDFEPRADVDHFQHAEAAAFTLQPPPARPQHDTTPQLF
jgi:hypothetical protein